MLSGMYARQIAQKHASQADAVCICGPNIGFQSYSCDICDAWHVGHASRTTGQRVRQAARALRQALTWHERMELVSRWHPGFTASRSRKGRLGDAQAGNAAVQRWREIRFGKTPTRRSNPLLRWRLAWEPGHR